MPPSDRGPRDRIVYSAAQLVRRQGVTGGGLREVVTSAGAPRPARAESLALLMISSLEGAIVLARTREDLTPLAAVVRELRPLLDAAAGGSPGAAR